MGFVLCSCVSQHRTRSWVRGLMKCCEEIVGFSERCRTGSYFCRTGSYMKSYAASKFTARWDEKGCIETDIIYTLSHRTSVIHPARRFSLGCSVMQMYIEGQWKGVRLDSLGHQDLQFKTSPQELLGETEYLSRSLLLVSNKEHKTSPSKYRK